MLNNKKEKGVYSPGYYNEFKCIADKCSHSCCIDWEICIDDVTYEKYKRMSDILPTVTEGDDGSCFELCTDGRCPHLNDRGLCNIIIEHGEEYLSEICKNHPRFYNYIGNGRVEAGIGIVCEEACRLILESEGSFKLFKTEELEDENKDDEMFFNALPYRDRIISIVEGEGGFDDKIAALREQFEISRVYTSERWLDIFCSLEILDLSWKQELQLIKESFLHPHSEISDEYGEYYERLLTYFVYRHIGVADSEENLRARLAFAILSVEVIRSLFEENEEKSIAKLIDYARRYSAEIEYSEDNTAELIFLFERNI